MRKLALVFVSIMALFNLLACSDKITPIPFGVEEPQTKIVRRISKFPQMPTNYSYYDYNKAARDFDRVAFDFANNPDAYLDPASNKALLYPDDQSTWGPVGFFDDTRLSIPDSNTTFLYKEMSFGLPTYVADRRTAYGAYEAITAIPSVLGGSYVDINKQKQLFADRELNFVEMSKIFYDKGTGLVLNTASSTEVGQSTWYDLYPQATFARLYDIYRDEQMKQMMLDGADTWLEALPHMKDDQGEYNFEFMGFDVRAMTPVYGGWEDPPCGIMMFLFYGAYEVTGEQKYLDGIFEILDYLETYEKNPNYEAITDFIPFVAAAINLKFDKNYNIVKYIDYLFENDSSMRANWGVLSGNFGDYPVDGLVGDMSYGFAMNSFNLASLMAPMVKSDPRFANSIGRYILNLVNNAKWFYTENMQGRQSMGNYLDFDKTGAICYEGVRASNNGAQAGGDASFWGQPCDLSLYSSAHSGYLGGIVSETEVKGIIRTDLNKTNSFDNLEYPTYMYYNPYDSIRTIKYTGDGQYDLLNLTTMKFVAYNVDGTIKINIPSDTSVVLMEVASGAKYSIDGNAYKVDGNIVARRRAAINIVSPDRSRYEMRGGDVFRMTYSVPKGDEAVNMKLYYSDTMVYDGVPLTEFAYSKDGLEGTDHLFKAVLTTKNGLTDSSSVRVVCF